MINIMQNSINNITSDVTSLTNSVYYFRHCQTNEWYVFLITSFDASSNGRYNIWKFFLDENVSPEETSTIGNDPIYNQNVYYYASVNGRINANIPTGEYDVYYTATNNATEIDSMFITFTKEEINRITSLTNDDHFTLYLRFNATLANIQ